MILVLALAAALWGVGAMMGAPRAVRLNMVLLLYVAVLALHLVLPDAHPLRMATGESAALWLILGGFVVVVLAYRWGLRRLKAKAAGEQAEVPQPQIGP